MQNTRPEENQSASQTNSADKGSSVTSSGKTDPKTPIKGNLGPVLVVTPVTPTIVISDHTVTQSEKKSKNDKIPTKQVSFDQVQLELEEDHTRDNIERRSLDSQRKSTPRRSFDIIRPAHKRSPSSEDVRTFKSPFSFFFSKKSPSSPNLIETTEKQKESNDQKRDLRKVFSDPSSSSTPSKRDTESQDKKKKKTTDSTPKKLESETPKKKKNTDSTLKILQSETPSKKSPELTPKKLEGETPKKKSSSWFKSRKDKDEKTSLMDEWKSLLPSSSASSSSSSSSSSSKGTSRSASISEVSQSEHGKLAVSDSALMENRHRSLSEGDDSNSPSTAKNAPSRLTSALLPPDTIKSNVSSVQKNHSNRGSLSLDDNMFVDLRNSVDALKKYIPAGYRDQRAYQKTLDDHTMVDQAIMWDSVHIPSSPLECSINLKILIRKGIPDPRRSLIWRTITGSAAFAKQNPEFYSDTLERVFGGRIPTVIVNLPAFGGRFAPENFYLTTEGINIAKRILCILGMEHPEIEYLPVIHDLVCIFLHFMTETDCYITIHMLLKNSKDNSSTKQYFTPSKKGITLFLYTFDDLINKRASKIFAHMKSLSINAHKFADEWFMRLFVGVLPFQTMLRVFDSFLNEGAKILYRVALGLLKLSSADLLKTKSETEFLQLLELKAQQCTDADLLMKTSFAIQLKRKYFKDLNKKNTGKVSSVVEPKMPVYYRPRITTPSNIIAEEQFELIWSWLPHRYCIRDPVLLYRTETHGFSLTSFFAVLAEHAPTILIIKTSQKEVFGAFASHAWKKNKSFLGDRDCFLWTFVPTPTKFGWVDGRTDYFMYVSDKEIQMGGGDGVGVWLDNELWKGRTQKCSSFENRPLTADGREEFECTALEVYGFS